ncbi:MAG TPA: isochorismatase family cysteine hydrolase [Negativicutes bacterium]|jgi:nicotinamidase-related amidase
MNKALIVIDYTYDFVAPDGALSCGQPGQEIANRIAQLIRQFNAEQQFIVIANDVHYENDAHHPEAKLFPPHNLFKSPGRLLYGEVKQIMDELCHDAQIHNLPEPFHIINKTRYSAFAGTDLELRLRERGIQEVHLAGVCTDICVLHTAVDAYNRGYTIIIHEDAVASFDPTGHAWALNHFANTLGALVIRLPKSACHC